MLEGQKLVPTLRSFIPGLSGSLYHILKAERMLNSMLAVV